MLLLRNSALKVRRHRLRNLFRVRQVQALHDLDELVAAYIGESRTSSLLLADGADPAASIVVAGVHKRVVREGEQPRGDAVVERAGVAQLEV
jgi:hypothetical protein